MCLIRGIVKRKIVVHGRKFFEILKEMDADTLDLDFSDNTMTMKQKQAEFVLSLQDPEEFPEVREITGTEEFSLSGATFLEMIKGRICHIFGRNEVCTHRYVYCWIWRDVYR